MKDTLFEIHKIENVITLKGASGTAKKLMEGEYSIKFEGKPTLFNVHAVEVVVNSPKFIRKLQITVEEADGVFLNNLENSLTNGVNRIELLKEGKIVFLFQYEILSSIAVLHGEGKREIELSSYEASIFIDDNELYQGRFYQAKSDNEVDLKVDMDSEMFTELNNALMRSKSCRVVCLADCCRFL